MNDKNQDLVLKTYQDMPKQFEQIFTEFKSVKLPANFKNINQVLICGMGGSALGPDLVRKVFKQHLSVPILIVNDYKLPKWVNQQTLVIVSSFSGNTEETLSCYKEAKRKKFKIFIICSGGKLAQVAGPKFVYQAKYNYALNPRFAIGYSVAIFISLFKKIKLLNFQDKKIDKGISNLKKSKKIAEKIAKKMLNKIPIIVASEHLVGNAHIFQNQINETGKNFAVYFSIPEICHHQFEGLSLPKNLNESIIYILINSKLYFKRNQKRYQTMKEILKKKKISFIEINSSGDDIWSESIYILGLSSYLAYYLAQNNKINPQPNPWVDYLKERMKI